MLNSSGLHTSNVTSMICMFDECYFLKLLNLPISEQVMI